MEKIFETFTVTILKINKLVNKIKLYEMQEFDLKSVHVMCVYYLNESRGGLTASELMRLTLEDKAAISRALKTLSDKGYISYNANTYNAEITLTEEGVKIAEAINGKAARAVAAGSADFSEEERLFFYQSLKKIADNLENYYRKLY